MSRLGSVSTSTRPRTHSPATPPSSSVRTAASTPSTRTVRRGTGNGARGNDERRRRAVPGRPGPLLRHPRHPLPRRRTDERQRTQGRSEEHTSELQSQSNLVCRLLLEKKKKKNTETT